MLSAFNTSADFSFTLPTRTTAWSRATRATPWRCQRRPPTRPAPGRDRWDRQRHHHHHRQRHADLLAQPRQRDRQRGQRRQLHRPSLQPDRSRRHRQRQHRHHPAGRARGAEASDFTNAFLADIDAAIASTPGVTRSGNTLIFDSAFNTSADFSFTLPTTNDSLVEGNESYSVALSAPTTNATGATVAIGDRQRHHHRHRQRHADLLAHPRQRDRQRGQRRQLHRPSLQPDRSRRHRQRQHRHHPAGRARRRRGGGFHQCLPGRHPDAAN